MDNQFTNIPLLASKSVATVDPRDQTIRKLETKNTKLKTELIKIQKAVQEKFGSEPEQAGPKKRESIFQQEDNFEVPTKELANIYKRIKMYEYEVNKLEDNSHSGGLSQKNGQFDLVIKEKRKMAEKLKVKLIREQKLSHDNIRKLEGNSQKEELETHMRKMTEEAKFYKERLKVMEEKEQIRATNMRRQYEAIKKYENQLLEGGLAGGELQEIKRLAVNSFKLSPERKTMQETKRNKEEMMMMSGSEEQIEDKTQEHYKSLLSEVALLEKMQNDFLKQMNKSVEEKTESVHKNMDSRNRLLECQNGIQNCEREIIVIKSRVVPSNLKPSKPLRSLSSHQGENPNKLLPAKYIDSSTIRSKASRQLSKMDTTQKVQI